jgi:hypothetical protein
MYRSTYDLKGEFPEGRVKRSATRIRGFDTAGAPSISGVVQTRFAVVPLSMPHA